jgi:hypothetical protein
MNVTNAKLIRLAGLSALIGGLCYVIVGVLHPANDPASVTTTSWAADHVIACAMSFFGLLGLVGIYARQAVKAGWLGLASIFRAVPRFGLGGRSRIIFCSPVWCRVGL